MGRLVKRTDEEMKIAQQTVETMLSLGGNNR